MEWDRVGRDGIYQTTRGRKQHPIVIPLTLPLSRRKTQVTPKISISHNYQLRATLLSPYPLPFPPIPFPSPFPSLHTSPPTSPNHSLRFFLPQEPLSRYTHSMRPSRTPQTPSVSSRAPTQQPEWRESATKEETKLNSPRRGKSTRR